MNRADYENAIVYVVESKDYGSAGIDGDSIDMSKAHRATFVIQFGALTGNSILTLYSGATTGAKTTALAFSYRFSGGDFKATNADVLASGTAVASTGLTLTAATYDHRYITINVESIDLAAGSNWLTPSIDATATVLNVSAVALCVPLYNGESAPSII